MGAFGDKFRKEREKKKISLDDVSNVTKIGSRMLQAIEQERFDQLPGGVFNKGFIRAYAKQLGMNEEEAVNDYLACVQKSQGDANAVWEPQAAEKRPYAKPSLKTQGPTQIEELPELQLPRAEHVRSPRNKFLDDRRSSIPWRLVAALALVLVLGGIVWMRRSRASHAPVAVSPIPQPAPAASVPAAPDAAHGSSSNAPGAHSTSPNKSAVAANHSSAPASAPGATKPLPGASSGTTPAAVPPSSAQPPATAPVAKPLMLVIRASENSWISVTADGELISQETLIAPAHASFRASREISVKVGNAAGVTFLWNGNEIPAQGAEAEAKTLTFDASGLRATQPVAAQPATAPQTNQ